MPFAFLDILLSAIILDNLKSVLMKLRAFPQECFEIKHQSFAMVRNLFKVFQKPFKIISKNGERKIHY